MYEVVIVWDDGKKEIYTYDTKEEAEKVELNMKTVFGNQLWVGITRR